MSAQDPSDDILHQTEVESVIGAEITEDNVLEAAAYALKGDAVIASPTAPGAVYAQAEAASMKTAVDDILAALLAAGIIVEA